MESARRVWGEREAVKCNSGTVCGWKGKSKEWGDGIRAVCLHRGVRQGLSLCPFDMLMDG